MRAFGGFILIFSLMGALLLAFGSGVGFLLHWIIPSVDIGIGILIGVITVGFTAQVFARIISSPFSTFGDDITYVEPLEERMTYIIDPEPEPRRRRRRGKAT
jgi:hypothetical protein